MAPATPPLDVRALALALLAALVGCGREAPGAGGAPAPGGGHPGGLLFPDDASARGLDYVNRSGEPAKATILEANGAGVAAIDLGADGDMDLVFAQGLGSLGELVSGRGADLEVFENDGRGHFSRLPGPGLHGWWTGLACGDVDGDGRTDLVAGGFGALRVLLQNERGELVPGADLAPAPNADGIPAWVSSLALCDFDGDGALDLYVGQYLELDPRDPPLGQVGEGALALPCRWKGQTVFCGPRGLVAQPDRVLSGAGDGTFRDISASSLPGHVAGFTLAVAPFDADGDGDTDVYVACDSSPNLLLVNERGFGGMLLVDHGMAAGVALSPDGAPEAGMGVAVGDVNRDGLADFAVTNFSDEATQLFFGERGMYSTRTHRLGLLRETRRLLSWGVHLTDFDGDGWLELFTVNGHVFPQADGDHTDTSYHQAPTLWHLMPGERARAVQEQHADSLLSVAAGARGSAIADFDLDGAPDLVLARIDAPAALSLQRSGPGHHRLWIRCLGPSEPTESAPRTPADGMGTRVILLGRDEAGAEYGQLAEVQTAVGYQSASTPWLHFGLGQNERFEGLRILWPSGAVEEIPGGPADRRITVREGEGIVAEQGWSP